MGERKSLPRGKTEWRQNWKTQILENLLKRCKTLEVLLPEEASFEKEAGNSGRSVDFCPNESLSQEVLTKSMYYLAMIDSDVARYFKRQGVTTLQGVIQFRKLMDRITPILGLISIGGVKFNLLPLIIYSLARQEDAAVEISPDGKQKGIGKFARKTTGENKEKCFYQSN